MSATLLVLFWFRSSITLSLPTCACAKSVPFFPLTHDQFYFLWTSFTSFDSKTIARHLVWQLEKAPRAWFNLCSRFHPNPQRECHHDTASNKTFLPPSPNCPEASIASCSCSCSLFSSITFFGSWTTILPSSNSSKSFSVAHGFPPALHSSSHFLVSWN